MSDSNFGPRASESSEVKQPKPAAPELSSPKDASFIGVLLGPSLDGESAHFAFARKEAELYSLFAELTVMESRAMYARLSNPRGGDELATAFMRMTQERRARLIHFLADARRREALTRTQKGPQEQAEGGGT
jgi:hypothetical protein